MERSVAYSLVRRRDFKDPNGNEKLFYAQAQARGEMGIREIGQRIEQMCTVTYADIMAVLCALPSVSGRGWHPERLCDWAMWVAFRLA